MRAAQFYGGKDIRVETLPDPQPARGQVLVQVAVTGICGSDLHGYHAERVDSRPPRIGGHESTGQIVSLGQQIITKLKVGDRVAIEPTVPCNKCSQCLSGHYNICSDLEHIGSAARAGGFAEYMTAPEDNVYPLPADLSFDAGALTEVYAVALHALSRVPVQPGDLVAVIGSGPVGLTIAQMAELAGAESVAVLGKPDAALQLAQRLIGCVPINVAAGDPVEAVKVWSQGRGATVVFEAVGGASNTLMQTTEIASKRGKICMVGGNVAPLTFSDGYARSRELTISWSFCYGRRDGRKEFQMALDLMAAGKLDPTPLITHRFALDEISKAFAVADAREVYGSVKVLVYP